MDQHKIDKEYIDYLESKEKEWESLCVCCGGCCGAYDDPCEHLGRGKDHKYYCQIYSQRLGEKKSRKGEVFDCVPVKQILHLNWKNDYLCQYKKYIKMPWFKRWG